MALEALQVAEHGTGERLADAEERSRRPFLQKAIPLAEPGSRLADDWGLLLDDVADGVVILAHSGALLYANRAAAALFGCQQGDDLRAALLADTDLAQVEDPAGQHIGVGNLLRRLAVDESESSRCVLSIRPRHGGKSRPVMAIVGRMSAGEGSPPLKRVVLRDLTSQRMEAPATNLMPDLLQGAVESSPLAIVSTDARGVVRSWNRSAESVFGVDADQVLGTLGPNLRQGPLGHDDLRLGTALLDWGRGEREAVIQRGDGTYLPITLWTAPVTQNGDPPMGAIAVIADASDRIRREAERATFVRWQAAHAQAQQTALNADFLAEASALLSLSLDYETTLQRVVRLAVPYLADHCSVDVLGSDQTLRRVALAHVDPEMEQRLREFRAHRPVRLHELHSVSQAVRSGAPVLVPDMTPDALRMVAVDEEHLKLLQAGGYSSAITVPMLAGGRRVGVIQCLSRHGRRYGATELEFAKELARRAALAIDNASLYKTAQEAIQTRDRFLSIAAHELRTPVAGIKGRVEMLLSMDADGNLGHAELLYSLRRLRAASDRLASLTTDLLDVSRMQVGRFTYRRRRLSFRTLVRRVCSQFRETAQLGKRLVVHLPLDPCLITGDTERLEQVLINVLDNARKYSPDGGAIHVSLDTGNGIGILTVRDFGIGLPPEAAETIFEPFGRASNVEDRQIPGMGLGLYICRRIVDEHGGTITALNPEDHHGAIVRVELPLARPAASSEPSPEP